MSRSFRRPARRRASWIPSRKRYLSVARAAGPVRTRFHARFVFRLPRPRWPGCFGQKSFRRRDGFSFDSGCQRVDGRTPVCREGSADFAPDGRLRAECRVGTFTRTPARRLIRGTGGREMNRRNAMSDPYIEQRDGGYTVGAPVCPSIQSSTRSCRASRRRRSRRRFQS